MSFAVLPFAANSVLRVWYEDESLLLQVDDLGQITHALAGRVCPYGEPDSSSGAGLWLANQACDLVQIHSSPVGTSVRVSIRTGGDAVLV